MENKVNVYFFGKKYSVPADLTIMTAMEYAGYTLKRGCGCRHGFCGACATIYRIKGKNELKTCLACQTQVEEGMYVASIPFFPTDKRTYDINDLKPVNDSFGHEWGDRVIRDFAGRLSGICRENELVARTGGDEFCGVFYGDSRQGVCRRIEAIQQEITQKPPRSGDMEVRYSFSYGLEGCDEYEDNSLRRMLKTTDDRMYEYKMEYKRKNCHGI